MNVHCTFVLYKWEILVTGSLSLRCMYGTLALMSLYSILPFPDGHVRYLDQYHCHVGPIDAIIVWLDASL